MSKHTEQRITDTLESNYMPYAMSVIVSRAIPEIDGFKPSHRKLLYTMYKMGLLTSGRTKSANVVGQTMKIQPHSDLGIYETMVRLTNGNEALLHPFVDSKGNFGKQYSKDMKYAASRYTEVKLEKICEEIFRDLDKDIVEFVDNYDGTMKEPRLLPTVYPNILANSNQGIAVGMASNICSFNLKEICEATINYIKDNSVDISKYIKAPDLSTGGELIYNEKDIKDIINTGRGSFKIKSKYKYDKENNLIEIYEIPYTTNVESIVDSVVDLVKDNKIKEITDIRDETDLNGLKITLELKRNVNIEDLMNKLFKLTSLQDTFSCNFNILVNGKPKVMGIKEIIQEWLIFRIKCLKRQINFDINKKTEKLHLMIGLKKIFLDIDKAIKIIKDTKEDNKVIDNLINGFEIDKIQAEFVSEIKLRNLNKDYILNKLKELDNLKKEIENLKDSYNSDNDIKIKELIIKQLNDIINKYGKERKTEILYNNTDDTNNNSNKQDDLILIEDYNLKLFLTKQGYLKKIPLTSLRGNQEQKIKEDDMILQELDGHNKTELLLFSNKQNVYKLKTYDLKESKTSVLGDYVNNILDLDKDENIIYITMLELDNYKGYMLFGFKNGKIAKIDLKSYETKTNRKKLNNAYSDNSKLVYIDYIKEDVELLVSSNINKVLIFNTEQINSKDSRNSIGVQVLKSKNNSYVKKVLNLNNNRKNISIADEEYYKGNISAIGSYLKKTDKIF